jgi:multiple sugar transport system permease protein
MKTKEIINRAVRALILAVILIWSGGPIFSVILSSLKHPSEIFETPPRVFFTPTLHNFLQLVAKRPDYFKGLLNSFIVTVESGLVVILGATLAGYALSRYRGKYLTISAFAMLAIRLLPPIVVTIPLFYLINEIRLDDRHLTLSIIYASFWISLATWIMKAFIDQIPKELDESALVDGATRFQILTRIIAPLSSHGIVAVSILVVIYSWKEYLFASLFTSTRAKTAPPIIAEMLGVLMGVDWGIVFAAVVIQFVPLLVVVLLVQKFLVRGMIMGAIKG